MQKMAKNRKNTEKNVQKMGQKYNFLRKNGIFKFNLKTKLVLLNF